ncbi:MAG: hypothetical protein MK538_16790, partial [Planctomycetes bacterium]|nr:hypothetical protein [Planctomycetota bacterium]
GDPAALATLRSLSTRGSEASRVRAACGVARLGGAEDISLIRSLAASGPNAASRVLVRELLGLADRLKSGGDSRRAAKIYREVVSNSKVESLQYAALYGLCGDAPGDHLIELLDVLSLKSERLESLVVELLTESSGGDWLDGKVAATYGASHGRRKAALLRVLVGRRVQGFQTLLDDALKDLSGDVQFTALQLTAKLDAPGCEEILSRVIRTASPATREKAVRVSVGIAARKSTGADEAVLAYRDVLVHSHDPEAIGAALVGLARLGDPSVVEPLSKARDDPRLRDAVIEAEAYRAQALALVGRKAEAVKQLTDAFASGVGTPTFRQRLVTMISELGGDVTGAIAARGFMTSWWIIGPFPNPGRKGFGIEYSPEKVVSLNSQIDHKGRPRRWRPHNTIETDGSVDFETLFRRTNDVLAYAYAELKSTASKDVVLKIGSDDGIAVWLNGEQIHANDVLRGFHSDQDEVVARLKSGTNRFLVKVTQGSGDWKFAIRLTAPAGGPLDLREYVKR